MKKNIEDFDLNGKRVIIRVDFNVPIKDNKIIDDNRIKMSLKTINYAINNNAKVILMSHLGRIKTEEDKINNSLKIVSDRLSELLGKSVTFISSTRGAELENAINNMNNGDVILIENTRFEDANGKLESSNDPELGKYWASLGEIFINDAFATCHRAHASNVGIASILPSGVGYLVKEEIEKFSILDNPKRPYTLILGGSKVSDKIGVIENMTSICDYILIGGGMAYTFLKSQGYNIGSSLLDEESIDFCKSMLEKYKDKIVLPSDSVVSDEIEELSNIKDIDLFDDNDRALDIGPKTIEMFKNIIDKSNTIVWNGPLGYYENERFAKGTKEIFKYLAASDKTVIIGGGDTAACAINYGYGESFTHISTGGGASLELLEGKELPGVKIINEKE